MCGWPTVLMALAPVRSYRSATPSRHEAYLAALAVGVVAAAGYAQTRRAIAD